MKRLLLLAALLLPGCGIGRETAPQQPAGTPQVSGTVLRSDQPVVGMKVKLFDDLEQTQVDSTSTDPGGRYGFSEVGPGHWMVKVSPLVATDLGYVRFFFDVSIAGQMVVVPPLDVDARGFDLVDPADSVRMPSPSFSNPLNFRWSAYQGNMLWASARIDDSTGVLAWSSPQGSATSAAWNGLGNQPPYSGAPVPPGRYAWRVKLRLANGVQAASRVRTLTLE